MLLCLVEYKVGEFAAAVAYGLSYLRSYMSPRDGSTLFACSPVLVSRDTGHSPPIQWCHPSGAPAGNHESCFILKRESLKSGYRLRVSYTRHLRVPFFVSAWTRLLSAPAKLTFLQTFHATHVSHGCEQRGYFATLRPLLAFHNAVQPPWCSTSRRVPYFRNNSTRQQ